MSTSFISQDVLSTTSDNIPNVILNGNDAVDLYNYSVVKLKNSVSQKYIVYCVILSNFEKNRNYESLVKHLKILVIKALELSRSLYKKETIIIIINFKNTKLKQMDYKFFKELIFILKTEYVDIVEKIIMTNIPVFFKIGYSIIKHFIDIETRKKIYFEKKRRNGGVVSYTTNFKEIEDEI